MKYLFNLFNLIIFAIVILLSTSAMAITLKWDASADWTDETKVVLVVTKSNGIENRLPSVLAKGCIQDVEDAYFDYGQVYKIKAFAYDSRGESIASNIVEYKHYDRPKAIELPIMIPAKKPETLILQLNFGGGE